MLALLSVWIGLSALVVSLTMVFYRPAFNDLLVMINMYWLCPLALTLAGLVLWGTRKERAHFGSARLQAKVGIGLALSAAAIVYLLVALADRIAAP